jgi:hypothetical protein
VEIMGIRDISYSQLHDGKLNLRENDTCFEYSENVEALKKLMAETTITIKVIGKDYYFDGDKEERIILRVYISRGKEEISFRYGMSIHDTQAFSCVHGHDFPISKIIKQRQEIKDTILYSILSCVSSEFHCPETFHDFCNEYGYDEDSRKAEKTFHACQEQSEKLHSIFKEEEIDCLPR